MRYLSFILLFLFAITSACIYPVTLYEKCDLLKIKHNANPLVIETTLGTALSNMRKGNFNLAIENVNDALVLFNSFDGLSHPYTTHVAGAIFLMYVYNFETIPVSEVTRFKNFYQTSVKNGIYYRPYEEVIGYTTLEVIELAAARKYDEALAKIDFAVKILKNVAVFNFMVEQEFINELIHAFEIKKADLTLLKIQPDESLQLYQNLSDPIRQRLAAMETEGAARMKRLDPGILFDSGRTLAELYYSIAFTHIRVNNLPEARGIIEQGLKLVPSDPSLVQLNDLIKGK